MNQIIMVCKGNIFRSPFAEAMLQREVRKVGLDDSVICLSAGTKDYHVGKGADPFAIEVARMFSIDLTRHIARQIDDDLLRWADWLVAMDNKNIAALQSRFSTSSLSEKKMTLLADFGEDEKDIPDPYGMGRDQVIASFRIIETCIVQLVEALAQERP